MKEIPILFSTEMVQALLAGRKTMTRRAKGLEKFQEGSWIFKKFVQHPNPKIGLLACFSSDEIKHLYGAKCPYGQVGDVLWVRESYCPKYFDGGGHAYKADWNNVAAEYVSEPKWKPAIHMPKGACRIKLKITNIRVERLQEITEEDAIAEGIEKIGFMYLDYYKNSALSKLARKKDAIPLLKYPINSFRNLWVSINGIHAWEDNPWVWVVEFERVQL